MPDWGALFKKRHEGIKGYMSKVAALHGTEKKPEEKKGEGKWEFENDALAYLKKMKEICIDNWISTGWPGPMRVFEWEDILKHTAELRKQVYKDTADNPKYKDWPKGAL